MTETTRDARLAAAFVKLADTLVDDYDVVELLNILVEESAALLDSNDVGLVLADGSGALQVVASTSEEVTFVEINQLSVGEGPCVEAFRTGMAVSIPDIEAIGDRWPVFARAALGQGFRSMHAFPMRLRGQTIGSMNQFSSSVGPLSHSDVVTAQSLADVATIGILQERLLRDRTILAVQLQAALDSRIFIEQAKGVIAAQNDVDMQTAFGALRDYARSHRRKLGDVAAEVAAQTLILPSPSSGRPS
ncbi:hypothetical protein CVS47_02574 [Microbacterium lemovicicum]|uniref:ANTAR domain-containing protein n=1 Tax=Microbacterium lemovicicum TaxID=1072463 RepID=A0A3Q9IZS1_9MICO|nr:GAF and ANTAR domain-containing protein [Microbacterium lemovicicum]AZS37924.1 hypothetical protein CVS47_02574 [Microbacterium lemovicicum]